MNNAGLEPDQKNNFTSSRGAHGYLGTDSLGEGRRTARDIASKQYKDIENIRSRGRYSKYQQREVFKTEPVDTSYYDAKKNHTEEVKKRRHDENTSVKKQRIQYQRDETNKIKNPLKKNIQKLNDKKGEKDIERDYRKQKRDINKGKYTYMYGEKEKIKELIKNRKQGK